MTIYRVEIQPGLLGDLYRSQTAAKGTVVFVPGLPSYQHRNIFAEALALRGFDVVQPFYYGSWVSSREFAVAGCSQTVVATLESCRASQMINLSSGQPLELSKSALFWGGISFGTSVLLSMSILADMQKVFLISAVPVFTKANTTLIKFDATEFVVFLQKGFPHVYRTSDWLAWQKELSGDGECMHLLKADINKTKVFEGEKDAISPAMIKRAFEATPLLDLEIIAGAGHSLTEFGQVNLAQKVARYLDQ